MVSEVAILTEKFEDEDKSEDRSNHKEELEQLADALAKGLHTTVFSLGQ